METTEVEWRSADNSSMEGPSLDFIRAVARLLETDVEDILSELGYSHPDSNLLAMAEV